MYSVIITFTSNLSVLPSVSYYTCTLYNVCSVRVKYYSLGQKYLCRAYNVGSVVEWNITVFLRNIFVEPTMLVES